MATVTKDAYAAVDAALASLGLGSLSSWARTQLQSGVAAGNLDGLMQETPQYKARFAGNAGRLKAGLPALSAPTYLAMEETYRKAARSAGLPKGFYDGADDMAKYIGADISTDEFASRVDVVSKYANNTQSAAALKKYYNLDVGQITALALDPTRALPALQKQLSTVQLGAESMNAGIGLSGDYLTGLVDKGVSASAAQGAFNQAAATKDDWGKLAGIDNLGLGVTELTDSALGLNAKADEKLKGMASRERARFGGSAGATAATGAFGVDAGGAY